MSEQEQNDMEMLQNGTIVDGYRVERVLGCGAMSVVYLATAVADGTQVALKVMRSSAWQDPELSARFCNEGEAASRLNHPNIIHAISSGELPDGRPYFCMEYAQGVTLLQLLMHDGCVPLKQAMRLFVDICAALEYGWDNFRFIHGDIKPENIMVTPTGEAKLVDFGLSRVDGAEYTGKDIVLTPLYAAPELIRGESTGSSKSDIYAFGATLFHAVAGEPPFPGDNTDEILDKQMNEVPEPLSLRKEDVPQDLSDFIASTLEKDPSKRPENWEAVRTRLMEIYMAMMNPPKTMHDVMAVDDEAENHLNARVREPKKVFTVKRLVAAVAAVVLVALGCYLGFAKGHGGTPVSPKGTSAGATQEGNKEPGAAEPKADEKTAGQKTEEKAPETKPAAPAQPSMFGTPAPAPKAAPKPAVAKPAVQPKVETVKNEKPAAAPASKAAPVLPKPAALEEPAAPEEPAVVEEEPKAPEKKEEAKPAVPKRVSLELCRMSGETREKVQLAMLAAEIKKLNLKDRDVEGISRRVAQLKNSKKYTTRSAKDALQCLTVMSQKLSKMPEVMGRFQSKFTRKKIDKYLVMHIAMDRTSIKRPGDKKAKKMTLREACKLGDGVFLQGIGKFLWSEMKKDHVGKNEYYEAVIAGMFFAASKEAGTYSSEKNLLVKECKTLGKLMTSPPDAKYIEIGKTYPKLLEAATKKNMEQVETLAKELQKHEKLLTKTERQNIKKIVAMFAAKDAGKKAKK